MAIKKIPESSLQFASGKITICEVLRRINDLHQGSSAVDKQTRDLLAEAITMAKKMTGKLLEYNKKAFKDFWKKNPTYLRDLEKRISPNYQASTAEIVIDEKLIELADKIPHMGARDIKHWLLQSAGSTIEKTAIVEIGAWLGSGTAFIAAGNNSKNDIFVYDHFRANESEVKKAALFGMNIAIGQDTLPIVKKHLKSFPGEIKFIKSDLHDMKWNRRRIGLLVDDVSKSPKAWEHTVKTFLPHVVAGGKIILMDYFYFEKTGRAHHKTQHDFMQKHKNNFRLMLRNPGGSEAIFLVLKKFKAAK